MERERDILREGAWHTEHKTTGDRETDRERPTDRERQTDRQTERERAREGDIPAIGVVDIWEEKHSKDEKSDQH